MGVAIDNCENLKRVLENSPRDWCLLVLLDRVNRDEAARQIIPLLDMFDQKSGELFDIYLGQQRGYHQSVFIAGIAQDATRAIGMAEET